MACEKNAWNGLELMRSPHAVIVAYPEGAEFVRGIVTDCISVEGRQVLALFDREKQDSFAFEVLPDGQLRRNRELYDVSLDEEEMQA